MIPVESRDAQMLSPEAEKEKQSGELFLRALKFQTNEALSRLCQAVSPTLVED